MKNDYENFVYVVKKENKKDPTRATIIKSGITAEFSVQDILEEEARLAKKLKNIDAELKFYTTIRDNYEKANPEMAKMITPENVRPFFEFIQAIIAVGEREQVKDTIQKAIAEFGKERVEIYKQIGMTPTNVKHKV